MSGADVITIVSGLPRSGTSMLMSMLEAGGIPALTDGIRTADEDNPKGYYEFERVKKIKEDKAWLPEARGKVVKMISQLLLDLPSASRCKILFMRRKIDEVLASQRQMLVRRGTEKPGGPSDDEMRQMLLAHVKQVLNWVRTQKNLDLIEVDYNEILMGRGKAIVAQINTFLGGDLNTKAMEAIVDKSLYRQRK